MLKWDDDRKKETVTESTVIEAMGDIIVANRDRKQNAYYKVRELEKDARTCV